MAGEPADYDNATAVAREFQAQATSTVRRQLGQVDPLRVADPRRNRAASLLVARPSRSRPTIDGAMNSRGARVSGFSCVVSYTAWRREGAGDRELCGIPAAAPN